eukprot:CAMPEP_0172031246 /NCGR_PEP_ID=MMETSP1041-20130122/19195_1 /TAXON_ID=464988 /ORGANISM="Hemiselmis andersenii, Strain CCMP439" /LENGTH=52 /DNA_ID=CAMNT_0012687729 /DNA_START=201 /DNA_END=359 /DNA_ORIENTATION=+
MIWKPKSSSGAPARYKSPKLEDWGGVKPMAEKGTSSSPNQGTGMMEKKCVIE